MPMSKPSSLQEVLQNLDPVISQHTFVYVGVTNQSLLKVLGYDPVAFYKEKAGITLILRKEEADNNFLTYDNEFCKIDLNAPFHFDCTGLTAIVSSALAKAGIAIRPVQTAYSRFILIEKDDAHTALEILITLQKKIQGFCAH